MSENLSKNEILLNEISRDLIRYFSETAKRTIEALFLINAGGITVILAYLNTSLLFPFYINCAFCLFSLGFISWAVLISIEYFSVGAHMKKVVKKNAEVTLDMITSKQWAKSILGINKKQQIFNKIITVIGVLSFVFGIVGIILGLVGFFKNIDDKTIESQIYICPKAIHTLIGPERCQSSTNLLINNNK